VLTAAGAEPPGSLVDALFDEDATLATVNASRIHLAKQGPETILNNGHGLARTWLVPADYTLAQVESKLLIERVVNNTAALDERYRLAHLLLHPDVRRDYAMIIIDTPPRMTLGTVNAFVASHSYVVPTILDQVSSEAIRPFLTQVGLLKSDLKLTTRLAAVIGTMTRELQLSGKEHDYFNEIAETTTDVLHNDQDFRITQNIPRKKQVTDSNDLGYFLSDAQGPLRDRFYDAAFDELWTRIMSPQESH
jgi:cellulose biosynthesis protein BcsQ